MNLKSIFQIKQHNQKDEENQLKQLTQAIDKLSDTLLSNNFIKVEIKENKQQIVEEKNEPIIQTVIDENLINENISLKQELESVKSERDLLLNRINNNNSFASDEELIERYNQLLNFAFKNIDPFTNIDILEARYYYENIIKK
jgi:hypothetical protein